MQKDDLKIYQGKRVRLHLKSNLNFTGHILSFSQDNLSLTFKDKFGNILTISLSEVSLIFEVDNGGHND